MPGRWCDDGGRFDQPVLVHERLIHHAVVGDDGSRCWDWRGCLCFGCGSLVVRRRSDAQHSPVRMVRLFKYLVFCRWFACLFQLFGARTTLFTLPWGGRRRGAGEEDRFCMVFLLILRLCDILYRSRNLKLQKGHECLKYIRRYKPELCRGGISEFRYPGRGGLLRGRRPFAENIDTFCRKRPLFPCGNEYLSGNKSRTGQ